MAERLERYLNLILVAGVIVWLGIVMLTPGPVETAKKAPQTDCAVICLDTQPITWPADPPGPSPAQPANRDWPDQQPI